MSLRVAYLGVDTDNGKELANRVKSFVEDKKLVFYTLSIQESYEYMTVCRDYDIIILDASIEEGKKHNYKFAMPFPADFILVVSRTQLPLNFYGYRDANLDKENNKLLYNSPLLTTNNYINNDELFFWIKIQIGDLITEYRNNPENILNQKDFFKKPISKAASLFLNYKKASKGWDTESDRRRNSGQIFISFRNISIDNKNIVAGRLNEVKRLVESGNFPGVDKKTVRFFEPNSLSNEIMSEQRRWQILSMIDRFIGPAEEVWIYEVEHEEELFNCKINPKNYYYNSWWTLGELLTLSYRGWSEYIGEVPKIRILTYHNSQYTLEDAPNGVLPNMELEQRKRMARWYANCDPSQMAPESVLAIRAYPEIPIIGFLLKRMSYFNDHVWSEDFWETPILDCSKCRCIGKKGHKFNIDDFLWTQGKWYTKIPKEKIGENRIVECNNCKTKYLVKRESNPHYYWIPPLRREIVGEYYLRALGFGNDISDGYDFSLVKIPVFTVSPI